MTMTIKELQKHLDREFAQRPPPVILEAGCGSGSNVTFPDGSYVVGIDISDEELSKNSIVDEKIVGDIQEYPLEAGRYDVIVCWDVLEHVEAPPKAMLNFVRALKDDGLLLLAFPNVNSLKGMVAKLTPHAFHTFVYRLIYGERYGQPGLITFPTYLKRSIAPARVERFAEQHRLQTVFSAEYESGVQRRFRNKFHLTEWRFKILETLTSVCSFGTLSVANSDCIFLFRKPAIAQAEETPVAQAVSA